MAVAATFLTVSASNALAQSAPASDEATTQATNAQAIDAQTIDAGVPMPDTSLVPPPTAADIKIDAPADTTETTASTTPATAPAASVTAPAAPSETAAQEAKEPTATPAAAQEPEKTASQVASADQPVADALRDRLQTQAGKVFTRKNERAAVEKFYAARDYAPLWTAGGDLTAPAKSVISRLADASADGLDPADYPAPNFAAATGPDALADAELRLTASILDYARQAQSGQMHWSQAGSDIQYPEHPVDPNEVLANITTAKDASAALQAYNPPHKAYRELRAKLAELRGQSEAPVKAIPEGPTLRHVAGGRAAAAMEDERVPLLRARLGVTENPDDPRYDEAVAAAVRAFQSKNGLHPDGILGNRTIAALNSPKRDRQIDTILVNMERWRWLPRQLGAAALGNAYAILNVPDFTLKVMQNDAEVWKTRVVVGKPGKHATPLLTETMKYITVNPTWNVPPSIINNEYLPALQQDPTVLDRMGLKLHQNRDGTIHISQPPGERNALGRLRFNFPNKFLVYQHDTPDKSLFSRDVRAFSHGCMRVQNPDQYAAVLLNIAMPGERYTPEKIRAMYGSSERNINFATPIPVNITYQTAFVDDAGTLQLRNDIYGRDAAMLKLLRDGKSKNLEAVVAHAQPNYARPRAQLPVSDRGGFFDNGPNFFERLFGVQPAPQPAAEYGQRRRIYR